MNDYKNTCKTSNYILVIKMLRDVCIISFKQYNFEGRYDLVKFIKEIQAQGLYVSLRIGPFIEAEWKYGYE